MARVKDTLGTVKYIPWGTGSKTLNTKTGTSTYTPSSGGGSPAPTPAPTPAPDPTFSLPTIGMYGTTPTSSVIRDVFEDQNDLGRALASLGLISPDAITQQLTKTPDVTLLRVPNVDYGALGRMGDDGGGGGGSGMYFRSGGGGGGAVGVGDNVTWSEGYQVENAPDWWRGLVPSAYTPNSEYVALYNAMIPYMSPEDQRVAGKYLYSVIGSDQVEPWGTYNPEMMDGITPPASITPDITEEFTSSDRVQNALQTLSKLVEVSGRDEKAMGAGYGFLRNILSTIGEYAGGSVGSGDRQTRAEYRATQGALDPLLSQAKSGELSPYQAVASQVSSPYFSAGNVVPISKSATGQFRFGNRNPEFYG